VESIKTIIGDDYVDEKEIFINHFVFDFRKTFNTSKQIKKIQADFSSDAGKYTGDQKKGSDGENYLE